MMHMKKFNIKYIDATDCLVYETTMEFQRIEHACKYFRSQGHDIITIKEVK